MPVTSKFCSRCNETLPATHFAGDNSREDTLGFYCRVCSAKGHPNQVEPPPTRICNRCGEDKPIGKYGKQKKSPDGRGTICHKCRASHNNKLSSAYADGKDNARVHNHRKRIAIKSEFIERLGGCCVDCGLAPSVEWPTACFDFHHEDPEKKEIGVSDIISNPTRRDEIVRELAGCVVLCANCHRRRHAKESAEKINKLDRPTEAQRRAMEYLEKGWKLVSLPHSPAGKLQREGCSDINVRPWALDALLRRKIIALARDDYDKSELREYVYLGNSPLDKT